MFALATVHLLPLAAAVSDTLLADYFCQHYYQGDADCSTLRARGFEKAGNKLPEHLVL